MGSRLLKEFVGNRVAMIQEKTEGSQWHHVSGHITPADLATKGVDLQELIKPDNIWFSGPSFLQEEEYPRSVLNAEKRSVEAEKRKLKGQCHVQNCEAEEFLKVEHFSSFQRLRKRVSFLRRPFRNWRRKKRLITLTPPTTRSSVRKNTQQPIEPLTAGELQEAEVWILKQGKRKFFAKEIDIMRKRQEDRNGIKKRKTFVPKSSSLYSLSPFLDEEGLLRVGGRIERSPMSFDTRLPIILGKGSYVAGLLIRQAHENVKHFGVNSVLCHLRQRYWPIREQVKKILGSCVLCKKWRGNPGVQYMADLPAPRVDLPNPPFTFTGVDYFGPITTKSGYRGGRREKRYGVIFTCLQTRAVHLEISQSLSTDDFLKVFSRFVARRSKPKRMFSDQDTNIVGAEREMHEKN